jgi:acetyltransferase-like isoleucine patch superfamily enzyme/dTDP-4-dehydrorhamnose 3,5-epimerase-like enzyme
MEPAHDVLETRMNYFVHDLGLCESSDIGAGTRVAAFAHVWPGAHIGADCTIGDHVSVAGGVTLGSRVTVRSGARLVGGVALADDVVVGPNVTVTDEPPPGAGTQTATVVGAGAFLGANATLVSGVAIGRRAVVGAGAVVTKDVPPNAVVEGNPARIVGYVDAGPDVPQPAEVRTSAVPASRVPGVEVITITRADDLRGSLVAANFEQELPFVPRRFFTVFGVPSTDVRGAHAHRRCHQLLVCVQGSINAVVDNGHQRQEFVLDRPDVGVHMEPMIWGTQYRYSSDAVLLVLASDPYDADDYIRDHDTFLREVAQRG